MKDIDVYLTRDTYSKTVEVRPATVGIRKFRGCTVYGSAWCKYAPSQRLSGGSRGYKGYCEEINKDECKRRFGFYLRKGAAWLVEGKKKTRVDKYIDFTY